MMAINAKKVAKPISPGHSRIAPRAHVTPANEQERAQVKELAEAVQEVTQKAVEIACMDHRKLMLCSGTTIF